MRALILALLPAAAIAACATPSAGGPAQRIPLRGADCLDPSSARSWHEVSSTEVRVDAGRRKYRLTLTGQCSLLGHGPELGFEGDPISGRVCGNLGDAILLGRGERCPIERIELIDAATWNETGDRPKANVSRAISR